MSRGRLPVAAVAGIAALLLASCTALAPDPVTDASDDVPLAACPADGCTGTLEGGAPYRFETPATWNGTLLLYSHHGETTTDRTGAKAPPRPRSQVLVAPPLRAFGDTLAAVLLDAGYALAGTTPTGSGWNVREQMTAIEQAYARFAAEVATPNRVYLAGTSLGGLATVRVAEQGLDWVSAAASFCAPLAGARPTHDLALDAAVATRALLVPDLKVAGFTDARQARREFARATAAVRRAAEGTPEQRAKVELIGALVDAADRTAADLTAAQARVVSITNLLAQSTLDRYPLEQSVGGNPSGTFGTDYRTRVSRSELAAIGGGLDDQALVGTWLRRVQAGARISPEPTAEAALSAQGDVTGRPGAPVIALHTAADEVYTPQHASWYGVRAAAAGEQSAALFLPLFTTGRGGVGGAGHCAFTAGDVTGTIRVLDDWVRRGLYPSDASVAEAFALGTGADPAYQADPWPSARLSPLDEPLNPDPADG